MNLKEILKYRKKFYDKTKDYTFIPDTTNHLETTDIKIIEKQQKEVFEQFLNFYKKNVKTTINYI